MELKGAYQRVQDASKLLLEHPRFQERRSYHVRAAGGLILGLILLFHVVWRSPPVDNYAWKSLSHLPPQQACPDQEPFYHISGFCAALPRNKSSVWLWRKGIRMVQQWTGLDNDPGRLEPILEDLAEALTPKMLLDGVRGRPVPDLFGHFLEKIELRRTNADMADLVKVLIIEPPVTGTCDMPGQLFGAASEDDDCSWKERLDAAITAALGPNVIRLDRLEVETSAMATHLLKYKYIKEQYDLILVAMGSAELEQQRAIDRLSPEVSVEDRILDWQGRRRSSIQSLVRAALDQHTCAEHRPPVVLVEDVIPQGEEPLLLTSTLGRTWQQLADYYRIGYVSYPQSVRQVLASEASNKRRFWVSGKVQQLAVTWLLLFAMLEYTVDYCEDSALPYEHSPLVRPHVYEVLPEVPPILDAALNLTEVTRLWSEQAAEAKSRREQVCIGEEQVAERTCEVAIWSSGAERFPNKLTGSGWSVLDEGKVMRASKEGASTSLSFRVSDNTVDTVKIFVQRPSGESAAQLEWTVTVGDDSTNLFVEVLPGVMTAETASITLPSMNSVWEVKMDLQLVIEDSADVVGLFLCRSTEQ